MELEKIIKALDDAHVALTLELPVDDMRSIRRETGINTGTVIADLGTILEWLQERQRETAQPLYGPDYGRPEDGTL